MVMRERSGSNGQLRREEEFRVFVARSLPTLLRGAYLLLRDVDLAEDAVQGTLLRVFRHWSDARRAPEAYSRQTLINVCRDHWRRQRRRPQEVLGGDPGAAEGSTLFSDAVEERDALDQALAELPQQQREVLVLRFLFDLSVAETAALLRIPEGTVKSSMHRGLRQLRDVLEHPAAETEAS